MAKHRMKSSKATNLLAKLSARKQSDKLTKSSAGKPKEARVSLLPSLASLQEVLPIVATAKPRAVQKKKKVSRLTEIRRFAGIREMSEFKTDSFRAIQTHLENTASSLELAASADLEECDQV